MEGEKNEDKNHSKFLQFQVVTASCLNMSLTGLDLAECLREP